MANSAIKVPDIGDFDAVEVIEVLVRIGDQVDAGQSLITLESDKASMEVPSPVAGMVTALRIAIGARVRQGDVILEIDAAGGAGEAAATTPAQPAAPQPTPAPGADAGGGPVDCDVLVIGAGPGGYTAAFRAADLGLKTILIERHKTLGGVCLNVGCIPSKALLHVSHIIDTAAQFADHGVVFQPPEIDLPRLRAWKDGVIGKLTGGLANMANARKIETVQGRASFASPHEVVVEGSDGSRRIRFRHAIIAAGSRPVIPPGMQLNDPRVMDSTDALQLAEVPERLLVIGGGIIGLEMATVYEALGSRITVVELLDRIMVGADRDLVRPYERRIRKRYENIHLQTRVTAMTATDAGIEVRFEGDKAPARDVFDRVLLAVGRKANVDLLNLEAAGVRVENGVIPVDRQLRTNVPHIHAIGDIVGQPMLAHKATHEGKVAAECIAGLKSGFDARAIPSVAYTDPEVAWVGLTEEAAKAQGIEVEKGVFPWAASGRALAMGRDEGMTKLLFDKQTGRLVGGAAIGPSAGDLMGEIALGIEMGAEAADIGLTVHPHPTLIETVALAAEVAEGTVTDLYLPMKRG
jgi:dihydrolipoamide dehydrogenase